MYMQPEPHVLYEVKSSHSPMAGLNFEHLFYVAGAMYVLFHAVIKGGVLISMGVGVI